MGHIILYNKIVANRFAQRLVKDGAHRMFDDAGFYSRMAQDAASYGKVRSDESRMYLAISALDFNDDLLSAIDRADDYLLDG